MKFVLLVLFLTIFTIGFAEDAHVVQITDDNIDALVSKPHLIAFKTAWFLLF